MGINSTYVRGNNANSGGCPTDGDSVLHALTAAYERGWQPADIVHMTRRSLGAAEVRLAVWAIMYEARLSKAVERAPRSWLSHLRAIREQHTDPGHFASTALQRKAVAQLWRELPPLPAEAPPPSKWAEYRADTAADPSPVGPADAKVLGRIRGLLAKAESTDFVEEAEIFTAKAQELMTKYAINAALLDARTNTSTEIVSRRIHVENPYIKQKVQLLNQISDANRVRTVWIEEVGMATAVGAPIDVGQVEMLFTSLLIQATRALRDAGADAADASSARAFRRAFLYGFAVRIGERLRQAGERATAAAAQESSFTVAEVLPVLASRSEAVEAEVTRLFPSTRLVRSRGSFDANGVRAGRAAADRANLRRHDGTDDRRLEAG
ncbi:DUF2786 domain-containing protein [Antrihabitans cavernicola]|uniref:DUF2786 domain-containing protein n=1 Tax=Antrihabitans cavernicola TaxID=2495913 RepID=A0A5A7SEG9_9NOCA|nr:DUF2786 domain-containing protein [Spelaeibacter cavernicola]KAA0023809.1 DUF2786 domain-containing protein [Spelaeibacter cavernicola]